MLPRMVALVGVCVGLPALAHAQAAEPARVYQSACAACHGADGRGQPRTTVGFDLELPDFTDCRFASREPDGDWYAVVHAGGPVRSFDRMMPAFGDAITGEEIQAALDHVRGFCTDRSWPRGELNLPLALFTEKAYPEDEAVVRSTVDLEGAGALGTRLVYEKRFGARNQIELILPFQLAKSHGEWDGGAGDFAVGLKRALVHSLERGHIFSVAGEVILPTGDESAGAGKGTTVFEPFVAFGQILPADSFVQLQAGLELPADTARAGREGFWRAAVGRSFAQAGFGRTWTPMLEILAARDLESGATTHWDLVPEMQVTLSHRQHVMLNVGVRVPVNDRADRPVQLAVYVLWDWFDGGFFEGWK